MLRLMGVAAVLLVATTACGAPSATPSSNGLASTPHFPLSLQDARTHFEDQAFECIGLDNPGPLVAEWICRHEGAAGRRKVQVGIQADFQGVTQLVGVAEGDQAQESAAFLIASVAGFVVPAEQRDALERWAPRHVEEGATRVFGNVSVDLQAQSDERWLVIVLPKRT